MLLINDEVIFVHVPRTGGMFTRQVIKSAGLKHEQINYTHGSIKRTHHGVHIEQSDYYSFGFVRNPWAWTVSIFLQFGGYPHDANIPRQVFERDLHNYLGTGALQYRYNEQFYMNKELSVDGIFKTEHLSDSLNYIFDKFSWDKPQELLKMTPINTRLHNSNKSYREYYTEHTKELVYNSNKEIIESNRYEF